MTSLPPKVPPRTTRATAIARHPGEAERLVDLADAGVRAAQHQERLAALGQGVAGVVHDLNSVLGAVSLYAELLGADQPLDEAGRQHVRAIQQQVERAGGLVWQILDFSNCRPPQRVPVDVVGFLHDLLPVVCQAVPPDVRVTIHARTGCHRVSADPARLQQVVLNLVSNAGDAIDGPGAVDIAVSRVAAVGGDGIRIDVSDTGCGVTDEVRGRAFEPFFTTKPPGRGTGLGLAQVHALVSEHDGRVDIHGAPGAGTTVSVWLPEAATDHGAAGTPRGEPGASTDSLRLQG